MSESRRLRIGLLSPWYGGSHRRWADGLRAESRHQIEVFTLPDRHWKWRLHGAAVSLAGAVAGRASELDLILADDMLDVAVLRGLLAQKGVHLPLATYFHENQVTYPVSGRDTDRIHGRDLHYGFINYTSALASDRIFFNSAYHKRVFLEALPGYLSRFPDYTTRECIPEIEEKSRVLPLGLDLRQFDSARPEEGRLSEVPLILWNHRWEYDKQPDAFLRLLLELDSRGHAFEVALLGERGSEEPVLLEELRRRLGPRILQDGPVDKMADYAQWLWRADIVPVTAIQDFFGASVVETLYCQCHVFVPNRLAYPEYVVDSGSIYPDEEGLLDRVAGLMDSGEWRHPGRGRESVRSFDWKALIPFYDKALAACVPD